MPLSQVKWGILGTSLISEVMAQAIQESSVSELAAIGSRSADKAKAFANKFSILKSYTNYQALLNDPEIDAIYIGLPNHLHKEWVIRCAQAKKHILCEKPFVVSAEEAEEVFSVLEKSNVFCLEALMYRYHPLTQKLQELIQSKVIGDIKLFNATYTANIAAIANSTAGGSIRNLGCYPISLIRLLTNAEPSEITALGRINPNTLNDHQASAVLKFENNTMAVVSTSDDMEMFWQFDVYGTQGCLKMATNPWLPSQDYNTIIIHAEGKKLPIKINVTAEKPLYTYQIDALSNKIRNTVSVCDNDTSWQNTLGNIKALDKWLQQIKNFSI